MRNLKILICFLVIAHMGESSNIAPAYVAPTNMPPAIVTPANVAPVNMATATVGPVKVATNAAHADEAPGDALSTNSVIPAEEAPVNITPTVVASSDPATVEMAVANVAPANAAPVDVAPANVAPAVVTPAEAVPADSGGTPAVTCHGEGCNDAPLAVTPAESATADMTPAKSAPTDAPAEMAPATLALANKAPTQQLHISSSETPACNITRFDGDYYNKELVVQHNSGEVTHISVNWNNGVVYFLTSSMENRPLGPLGQIFVVKDGAGKKLAEFNRPLGIVVNQYDGTVFLMDSGGVSELNLQWNQIYGFFGYMNYFNDLDIGDGGASVLCTKQYSTSIVRLDAKAKKRLPDVEELKGYFVNTFTVDRRNNIIFESDSDLSILNNLTRKIDKFDAPATKDRKFLVSKKNEVWYVTKTDNVVFKVDRTNFKSYEMGHLAADRHTAIALDANNNIVFGKEGAIFRLRKLDKDNCALYLNRPKCQIDNIVYC